MTTSLTSKVSVNVSAQYSGSPAIGSSAYSLAQSYANSLANGSSANQASKVYSTKLTISASGTSNLDFYSGLSDALGNSLSLAGIKAIVLEASSGNTNDVIVGNAGSNAVLQDFFTNSVPDSSSTVTIKPGGVFVITNPTAAGYVVDATHANLLFANSSSGTSVEVDVVVLGI